MHEQKNGRTHSFFKYLKIAILITLPLLCIVDFSHGARKTTEGTGSEYRIGCGDILEIIAWKEPDFTRDEVIVRIDGKITLPLLNDIEAAGLTPLNLKKNIEEKLKKFVDVPVVTVIVKAATSQKFYILGEVLKTGEYNLVKELTVLQAFAMAGGFTEWASKKEILVIKHKNGQDDRIIKINYKGILKGRGFNQDVMVEADDTIIVP